MKEIKMDNPKEIGIKPNREFYNDDLQAEKGHLLHVLGELEPTSDEYHTVMNRMKDIHAMQLEELHEKNEVLKINASMEVNPNTVIATGGSIAAILLIMNYERLHALTSKGVSIATRMIPRLV